MPLYEYGCRACGARFELMRKVDERLAPPECNSCGKTETSLYLSAPGHVGVATGGGERSCATDPGSCCGGACMN